MKAIVLCIASALAGAVAVVACSDDSPHDADAAVCDCPAAEPPITSTRLHRVDGAVMQATANGVSQAFANCPAGEIAVSGSCYIDTDRTPRQVWVQSAGALPVSASMTGGSWACNFVNNDLTNTADVHAQALCFKPAP